MALGFLKPCSIGLEQFILYLNLTTGRWSGTIYGDQPISSPQAAYGSGKHHLELKKFSITGHYDYYLNRI